MQDFRNLNVWQKAHALVLEIYVHTADFSKEELFGLRTQLRKTSVDIAAYISEGCGKPNDDEFARSISISLSNSSRLEYYLLVAKDLLLLDETKYEILNSALIEIKKMLNTLLQRLR
jgi:four helix bundle protein